MISPYMTQYKLTFFILLISSAFTLSPVVQAADAAKPSVTSSARKTPEQAFADGLRSLQQADNAGAQVALSGIPSQSPYAKLLAGNIAVADMDFDSAFRLLLPLQAEKTLNAQAAASLHASLAQAYDNQDDALRALEQRVQVENWLQVPADITLNQDNIWRSLTAKDRASLIDMRGNSLDTTIQGWIDLALAAESSNLQALTDWRNAYPDHPAKATEQRLERELAPATDNAVKTDPGKPIPAPVASDINQDSGQIALILPFSSEAYYPAADAIERGFMAAQQVDSGPASIRIYASEGDKTSIATVYQQALSEGAQFIVGPLTRDEVSALASTNLPVPTLALNYPDIVDSGGKMRSYGLSADMEAAQIVKIARDLGMQTATVVSNDDSLSSRVAKAFNDAWIADGGTIRQNISVSDGGGLDEVKQQIAANPSDMIFLSAAAEAARVIRPALDIATPTFGISRIYNGIAQDPEDTALSAVRFVDMPWLLNGSAYQAYHAAAGDLPPGEMQRWFALGVDAYRLLPLVSKGKPKPATLNGLSGKIRIRDTGEITRELAQGRFGNKGVVMEKLP